MAQVLEKLRIRAVNSSKTLIKVVKNPVTDHLPTDCLKVVYFHQIGTSVNGRMVKLREYVPKIAKIPGPVVMVVGAVSKGDPGTTEMTKARKTTTFQTRFASLNTP